MRFAFESLQDIPMRVNRMNVDAMDLLSRDRGFEAVALLRETSALDPQNPFTLNNLGVAEETIGDYSSALKYYTAAAESHSSEPVVVTLGSFMERKIREPHGRGERETAGRAAAERSTPPRNSPSCLTFAEYSRPIRMIGSQREQDFLRAYSLDPASAFSLNNRGYVAERDGDLEIGQFFYEKARRADDSYARVGLATRASAEGEGSCYSCNRERPQGGWRVDIYSQERRRAKRSD